MKNRCIIAKFEDNVRFICLGETDSIAVTNTPNSIILFSLHGDDSFNLKTFLTSECEIKDQLYNRLCYFLQYGKISVLDDNGETITINTFNVEQQIDDIKKILDK